MHVKQNPGYCESLKLSLLFVPPVNGGGMGSIVKEFRTTGACTPDKNYMVDLTRRLQEIKKMVDAGQYFTINRARQYGKTTTLTALAKYLVPEYIVASLDFQSYGSDTFANADSFCRDFATGFCGAVAPVLDKGSQVELLVRELLEKAEDESKSFCLFHLATKLKEICSVAPKPVVLQIDEVDSATNNQVFLDFLAQLREGYLSRETKGAPAFQSVILAGVTDIKYLKNKMRDAEQHKVNSPWNVAADFTIDMSLSETGIKGMLDDYKADHSIEMDTAFLAKLLRDYTGGYPFLVSRLCQIIDTRLVPGKFKNLAEAWTCRGIDEAVKLLLSENNTLFQSLAGKLNNFPELKESLHDILMQGKRLSYNAQQESIEQMQMYGFICNDNNTVKIANRIFETLLYNYFLSDEELKRSRFYQEGMQAGNLFVKDGVLDMRFVLERFIETYHQVYGPLQDKFKEKDGREQFLLYLKPIINGTGNYYIEAQTRDQTRTDVVVDYLGQQYVVELKIWRGERYNAEGEKQIAAYLDYFGLTTGYMLSFNFNKKKEIGVKRISVRDKVLFEGTM